MVAQLVRQKTTNLCDAGSSPVQKLSSFKRKVLSQQKPSK